MAKRPLSFAVTDETVERLNALAERLGVSRSQVLERLTAPEYVRLFGLYQTALERGLMAEVGGPICVQHGGDAVQIVQIGGCQIIESADGDDGLGFSGFWGFLTGRGQVLDLSAFMDAIEPLFNKSETQKGDKILMPRQETVLSIFVASPSDVDEERNRLEDVIRDLNTAWARDLRIRLELVRWETHAYPSFGEDPQAVINEQVPQDFDLFIGLMWYRFGTPTDRAESGTVEEFQRAKERYDANPNDLQLMIYFKDAPVPVSPSQLDHKQLEKISEFRSGLGEEGGLHWSFQTVDEFERLVRLHITRFIQTRRSQAEMLQTEETITPEGSSDQDDDGEVGLDDDGEVGLDDDDEVGILDLMEQFEDEFSTLKEITDRISDTTVEIGNKIKERTDETTKFAVGPNAQNRKVAKRIFANVAADMDQYVHRIESELPLFSKHLNAGLNALTEAVALSIEFKKEKEDREEVRNLVGLISDLRVTMEDSEGQLDYFRGSVASLPRLTTVMNRSKRAMVNIIQRQIDELSGAQVMLREAETTLALMANETMSETQVEQEIAKICKREGMYEFKSGGDLGYISNELTKIESKDRLPEEFKSENAGDREAKLFRFLHQRGWKCGQEKHGTCRVIFKLPDIYM